VSMPAVKGLSSSLPCLKTSPLSSSPRGPASTKPPARPMPMASSTGRRWSRRRAWGTECFMRPESLLGTYGNSLDDW
jgi:hypothetical protein